MTCRRRQPVLETDLLSRAELAFLGRSPLALKLLTTIAATRCSPFDALDRVVPRTGYGVAADIAYGSRSRQRLDVYRPEGDPSGRPVIVYLYGGGWRQGERASYRFVGQALTGRGFVTVIPDYRLFPEVRFPSFVEDAAAALRWARDNAARHGGDPERIVLVGHSAGAHSAALLALDPRYTEAAGLTPNPIKAVVGLAGPYAFDPLQYDWTRSVFEGAAHPEDPRPVTKVLPGAPPMLLQHGGLDQTVWPVNSEQLARRLGEVGTHARLITYPKLGHITIALLLAAPFQRMGPVLTDMLAFLEEVVGN